MKSLKRPGSTRKKLLTALAVMVVFVTTYMLIIPAITIDRESADQEPGMVIGEMNPDGSEENEDEYDIDEYDEFDEFDEEEQDIMLTETSDVQSDDPEYQETFYDIESEEEQEINDQETDEFFGDLSDIENETDKTVMPEMTLTYKLGDTEIIVEAEEETFVEGTALEVRPNDETQLLELVKANAAMEINEEENIKNILCYDVYFVAPDGEKIKPLKNVRIHVLSNDIEEAESTIIVGADETTQQTEIIRQLGVKETDETNEKSEANEVVFETAAYTTFFFVYTEKSDALVQVENNESETEAEAEFEIEDEGETKEEAIMPEMTLTTEIDGVLIQVEAEEGSLPEGTTLKVIPVDEESILEAIEGAVNVEEKIERIVAYDICFLTPDGEEIEPLKSVRVTMTSPDVAEADDTYIVHVEDETLETKVVDRIEEESKEDEVIFASNEFSVYGYVFTQKLTASVLTSEGESYTINVYLDENSGIPEGAELIVNELQSGTDEYISYLNETKNVLDMDDESEITFARFFDIEIQFDGEKLEPQTPAKVELIYNDPLNLENGRDLNIVHFADEGIEVIDDLKVDESGTTIIYEQGSFSVTGTIIQGTLGNGQQGMLIIRDNGSEYIVLSDGTLASVDQINLNTFETENPMIWKYTHDTYYHETRAYDFNGQQIASDFYYSYINAKEEDGIADDNDSNINPEHPLNQPVPYGVDGRRIGDYSHRSMWPASATILENHHMRNRDPENGNYYYIGVERGPDGKPIRITGRNSLEDAAEIYLGTSSIPSSDPGRNRVNHIDISIKGTASITYPLTRGYTYYYENGSSYTPTEKTTVTLSQEVGIKTDDMRKATISAFTKDNNGTRHPIDDVFYITGYSANAETQYSTDQVRIEGSFKVTTTDSTNWSERIKKENRIYYSVDASKDVTFQVTDPTGRQLYDENHQPITVTVNVKLGASFDYWDERNECPPVRWTLDSWRQGDIMSHGLSGMDFVLGGNTDLNTLEIIKMIEDENGNIIKMRPGTFLDHDFDIYQRVNGRWELIDTKTTSVGSGGVGYTSDYGVPDGSYVIREKTGTIPLSLIDENRDTWVYSKTYFETEGGNRRDWPNEHDRWGADPYLYESEAGAVGANNRDVQFSCHNIYVKKVSVEVEKKWYQYGKPVEAPENAKLTVYLGRYSKIAGGGSTGGEEPDDPPEPETPDRIKATIDIFRSNYGHQSLLPPNVFSDFYAGQTLLVTLNKQKQASVYYAVAGEKIQFPVEEGNGERQDYSFTVVVPEDGILSIPLDDAWSDVQNIRVQTYSSGHNVRRLAKTSNQTESISWKKDCDIPEGYRVDGSFIQPVILSNTEGWSRSIANLDSRDANGNEYLYYIAQIQEENVPKGTTVEVQQPYTTTGDEPLKVSNYIPPEKTEVSFTKRWFGADLQVTDWPEDQQSIQVTLNRYRIQNGVTYTDDNFNIEMTLTKESGNGYTVSLSGSDYVYTISELDKYHLAEDGSPLEEWIYTITETVPFGYHVRYLDKDGSETFGANYVADQGVIENHLDVYQLPHTGGSGTFIYTISGMIFILIALCLLIGRHLRERRSLL
ncbi:MAG: LPXTG cell wall anchor domain-containing protein [Eubacteriales bacterium]|nr:LPXTG cell wall anchor domain-containing protein [Eubacteriales bacterium]